MEYDHAIRQVIEGLREAGAEPIIGGSYASSAWGEPRATHDLDIVIRDSDMSPADLIWTMPGSVIVNEREADEAFRSNTAFRCFQLFHTDGLKVDVFVVSDTEYSQSQVDRSRLIEIIEGFPLRFAAPEDTVLAKIRWYLLGNKISERQWNDLVRVIETQGDLFDAEYLLRWARHFHVQDLAMQALEEARHPFGNPESEPER
jgi:hypothetical protein